MAKSMSLSDNYVSQAVFDVTESAANTLTFEKLTTGLSVYDQIGWVICRVKYALGVSAQALFNATGDTLSAALTMTNSLSGLGDADPQIYDYIRIQRTDFGTAANAIMTDLEYIHDFSGLPGGGLLVLPEPLYLGVAGLSLSGAAQVVAKIYFKAIELTQQDYFNLVQARQLLIST